FPRLIYDGSKLLASFLTALIIVGGCTVYFHKCNAYCATWTEARVSGTLSRVINFVMMALTRYRMASIHANPSLPAASIKIHTISGPTKTANPAPRFKMTIAAPLSFVTREGTKAERGT